MARTGETGPADGSGPADGAHRWYLSVRLWAKLLAGFGTAALVTLAVLRFPGEAPEPPLSLLFAVGLVIAVCTTAAVYWGVRHDLGLPARTALYAVGYNALVVVAKFVVAPRGIYRLNEEVPLESFFPFTDPGGAVLTAVAVLLLYLGVLTLIYRYFRRKIVSRDRRRLRDRLRGRRNVTLLVVGVVLFAAGAGTATVVSAVVVAGSGLTYLSYVFTSAASLVVGLAVAGATALAVLAFRDVRDRVQVVGDASVIVGFFWLGLFVLVLYHALWVVFILVLTAVWPLKVVIPK